MGPTAGTVDPGEQPADAAVRELQEETGVEVQHVEFLGKTLTTREDDLAYTLLTVMAHDGLRIPPGYRVHVLGIDGEEIRFARRESDHSKEPPELLKESTGATSSQSLTRSIERHFYAAEVSLEDAWPWEGDDGQVWRCHFLEIGKVRAFGEQQGWLDQFAARLRSRS